MLKDTSLLYFYEVARCGSIRQAAEHLHVSPSAISRMITKAEHQFQAELFERRAKGMYLTEAGRILAEQMRGVVGQLRDARTHIDELKGLRRGEVQVHCIEGIVQDLMPSAIAAFHERHPQVAFRVNTGGSDAIVEALLADQSDFGISFNMRRSPGIEVLFTFQQPLHALVAPSHPLNRGQTVSLREVVRHPIAMPDPTFGVRGILDRALRAAKLEAPMFVTTNSLALTRAMARTGAAITLSPPFAAAGELAAGQLVAIPISERQLLNGTMSICKRRGRRLSAAAMELVDYVRKQVEGISSSASQPRLAAPSDSRRKARTN
jgi:DNA-binding transcriptional LysR family regulator